MEQRLENINNSYVDGISPYQAILNKEGKKIIFNNLDGKLLVIWSIPLALTFVEIIYLKHNILRTANKVSLYKWLSYIGAAVLTNFTISETLRKAKYFDRIYPSETQSQKQLIVDADILRRTYNKH